MRSEYDYNDYFQNNQYPQYNFMVKRSMKNSIKKAGLYTGCALLLYILIQNIIVTILKSAGLLENFLTDKLYQSAIEIFITVISLMVPFILIGKRLNKQAKIYAFESSELGVGAKMHEQLMLSKPKSILDVVLGVFAGVGICMVSNIITSIFTVFASLFGYELTSPELAMPTGVFGVFLTIMRVSVLAALTEELALRGYVMGSLRIYGEKFAVIATSVVFALMHGNLIQTPFALLAGFGLGYLAIKTSTLWTAIIVHTLNNFISVVISYLYDYLTNEQVNVIYYSVLLFFIVTGAIAFLILSLRRKDVKVQDDLYSPLTLSEKMKAFFLNFAMIMAIGYMLVITASYIN